MIKRTLWALLLTVCIVSFAHAVVVRRGGVKVTTASRTITWASTKPKDFTAVALAGQEFGVLFETGTNDTLWVVPGLPFACSNLRDKAVEIVNPNLDTIYVGWVQYEN